MQRVECKMRGSRARNLCSMGWHLMGFIEMQQAEGVASTHGLYTGQSCGLYHTSCRACKYAHGCLR